ncbi:hypothetical protein NJG16_05270 [Stenotrophomonas maltophilia]|nr:hypothetical protein [Stenotrophomonas maltophilia]
MTTDKTPATLAVDVLAVMGIAATTLHADNYSGTAKSMDAARAAVAELIEADEELIAAELGVAGYEAITRYSSRNYRTACYVREREAIARRKRALARVKGESA